MYLYFKNSQSKLSFVCECTQDDVCDRMTEYIKKKNPKFKIYYIRSHTTEDSVIHYDVGSHTEFFWLSPEKMDTDKQYECGM